MFSCHRFPTGVKRKPGGGPPVLPHLVSVHDDFPAVSLERLHPVLCPHAGGVPHWLLGPERKPDGETNFSKICFCCCCCCEAPDLQKSIPNDENISSRMPQWSWSTLGEFSELSPRWLLSLMAPWTHQQVRIIDFLYPLLKKAQAYHILSRI